MKWYTYVGIRKPETTNSLSQSYPEYLELTEREVASLPPGVPLFRKRTLAKQAGKRANNMSTCHLPPSPKPDRIS